MKNFFSEKNSNAARHGEAKPKARSLWLAADFWKSEASFKNRSAALSHCGSCGPGAPEWRPGPSGRRTCQSKQKTVALAEYILDRSPECSAR